ncbi:hypothetical protein Tco_0703751 [Tanacetum coccineum]|uniref:Uncharacterized protein n=1 Tax=Tanacetum coccineum TaxID=301880 RepID=A0ABQ4Y0P6_9ASTR
MMSAGRTNLQRRSTKLQTYSGRSCIVFEWERLCFNPIVTIVRRQRVCMLVPLKDGNGPMPKESGIKDLFGGEICTMMSPGGSIVASFENVESFFASCSTTPDHLIAQNFEQERVMQEVVF